MKTERNHSDEKLLVWKKVILTAEAFEGTRADWMRHHGISDGSYYYWHKVLSDRGMLDDRSMDALDVIPLPEPVQNGCTDEQTCVLSTRNPQNRKENSPLSEREFPIIRK